MHPFKKLRGQKNVALMDDYGDHSVLQGPNLPPKKFTPITEKTF